jgi:enoyl-CoA hydratase/carnithine racemase
MTPSTDVSQPESDDVILLTHTPEGVSRITFNRPRQRNAMNRAARAAIVRALDECRSRSKVIILSGNGPAFCAGVDLKESGDVSTGDALLDRRSEWAAVQEELRRHPAIVIAAVHGYALGGGSTLINVADLAIAAEDAQIGMPEIGFGLYPTLAGPAAQLRIAKKRAAWLVLTADRIDGITAAEWGLVNKAVPAALLNGEVTALAHRLASFDAVSLDWSKRALWKIPDEISEWSSAMEYGDHVAKQISARTDAIEDGLAKFNSGKAETIKT